MKLFFCILTAITFGGSSRGNKTSDAEHQKTAPVPHTEGMTCSQSISTKSEGEEEKDREEKWLQARSRMAEAELKKEQDEFREMIEEEIEKDREEKWLQDRSRTAEAELIREQDKFREMIEGEIAAEEELKREREESQSRIKEEIEARPKQEEKHLDVPPTRQRLYRNVTVFLHVGRHCLLSLYGHCLERSANCFDEIRRFIFPILRYLLQYVRQDQLIPEEDRVRVVQHQNSDVLVHPAHHNSRLLNIFASPARIFEVCRFIFTILRYLLSYVRQDQLIPEEDRVHVVQHQNPDVLVHPAHHNSRLLNIVASLARISGARRIIFYNIAIFFNENYPATTLEASHYRADASPPLRLQDQDQDDAVQSGSESDLARDGRQMQPYSALLGSLPPTASASTVLLLKLHHYCTNIGNFLGICQR